MYVTLQSWSQSSISPSNKGGQFVTKFEPPLQLPGHGQYEVALTACHYPRDQVDNISDGRFIYILPKSGKKKRRFPTEIPPSTYDTLDAVIRKVKAKISSSGMNVEITYDKTSKKVTIDIPAGGSLQLGHQLAIVFGFRLPTEQNTGYVDLNEETQTSPYDYQLNANFQRLHVLTNIVEHEYFGNVMAPVLRTFSRDESGDFYRNQYKKVKSNTIDEIRIEIRNDAGDIADFNGEGVVGVLHFRLCL